MEVVSEALRNAERPLIFEGGQGWDQEACDAVQAFAERYEIPVLNDMRSSDKIHFSSPANAGWLGSARSDDTAALLEDADLVLAIGGKLWDKPTDNFSLRQEESAQNILINSDPDLKANSGSVAHHVLADPSTFAAELYRLNLDGKPDTGEWFANARATHEAFSTIPSEGFDDLPEGSVDMNEVMAAVVERLGDDAICTYGAGNHCFWPQRFFPTRQFPSMLATRLGSMGYSVAAGMAAKIAHPDRQVVVFTGDGELMMNGQEIVTAVRYDTPMIIVLVDNAQYGTIRAHQRKHYPDRVEGTQLSNPDFVQWAESMGAWATRIDDPGTITQSVQSAFDAVADGRVALLHVIVDQGFATPAGSAEA